MARPCKLILPPAATSPRAAARLEDPDDAMVPHLTTHLTAPLHPPPHRPAPGARARGAGPAPGNRGLVPQALAAERAALLFVGGPAQQRLQAGARRYQPLPRRLQQPQSGVPAAVRARGDVG